MTERDDIAVARIVPEEPRHTWIGRDGGTLAVPENFGYPLPPELQQYFE